MTIPLIIIIGRIITFFSRLLNWGNGTTWPGEIALRLKSDILNYFFAQTKKGIILVAGTNGKTTTSLLITKILKDSQDKSADIIHNSSGANLVNGLVSSYMQSSNLWGQIKSDWSVLEVDENILPLVIAGFMGEIKEQSGKIIVILQNLFRDQLDRYGEVDTIARKWQTALKKLPENSIVILNADDPQIAGIGNNLKTPVKYFGVSEWENDNTTFEHATDSLFCSNCAKRLIYKHISYSHLGDWKCSNCNLKRPRPEKTDFQSPLLGLYNRYNDMAAGLTARELGITDVQIKASLKSFFPAFGRQEEFSVSGRTIKIFLAKNPAGFNESLRTVLNLNPKVLLLVLNDRIPDGRDVSWIWDVDFEMIQKETEIICSGDRVYDMGLRIKYADIKSGLKYKVMEKLPDAIKEGLNKINPHEYLYILATYSAMLEVRKILKGRKIL